MILIAKGKFSQPRGGAWQEPEESRYEAPAAQSTAVKKSKSRSTSQARTRKVLLICLCAVAVVLLITAIVGIWFFMRATADDGLILNNVTAAGINLGGMTKEEAAATLHKATDHTYTEQDMVVELPDIILNFSPADTGAKLDVEAVVEDAYNYGHTGTREEKEQAKQAAQTTVHHIALLNYLELNTEVIRTALDNYGANFNSTYTESTITLEGDAPILDSSDENFDPDAPCQTLVLYLGTPGRKLDMDDIYDQVLDAYSFNQFLVTAEMENEEKIPDEIDLLGLHDQYSCESVDAVMDPETYEVTPEIYGYTFDLENAQVLMEEAQYGDTIRIEMEYIVPDTLHEELSGMLFRDVLASYETKHTNNANRNTNLELACAAINGIVLEPGDVFDYNKALGKRTEEAGYKYADAYSGGQTVKELGGGICQVSSTLYYCTLIADLEIVSRTAHSYVSSYMPMGMDATVSWGGPEFRFKNNFNYPIRIEAEVSGGYVKVKLIGTDEKDYYVKMEYEVLNTYSPTTVYEEISADNNPKGYKDGEVIATAYTGYNVQTYKLKYSKDTDELLSKEEDQLSKYKKRDKTIAKLVTTTTTPTDAPVEPTPTEAPAATEAPATTPTEAPAATEAPPPAATEAPTA